MKAASPVTPHSPLLIFGTKFGKDFSSFVTSGVVVVVVGGGGVVVGVCDGCFDLSQQNFLSALLQIRLLSLAKIVLYSELVFPFSAPTFLKSSSFDLYETQLSLGRQE